MAVTDHLALEQLHYDYLAAVDDADGDALADLFVPEGTLVIGSTEIEGRAALRAFLDDPAVDRHAVSQHLGANGRIDVDGSEATASWCYLVIKADDREDLEDEWAVGRHRGEYRKDPDWSIVRLDAQRILTRPLSDGR